MNPAVKHLLSFVAATVLMVLAGCEKSDDRQAQVIEEGLKSLDGRLDGLITQQQAAEIQQQLNLVTKEVVALNEQIIGLQQKLDQQAAAAPTARTNVQPAARTIDGVMADTRIGAEDAKYAIVEFMDYQCPYCVRYAKQVFPELRKRYIDSGKFQYIVRDYPLRFHAQAKPAAVAAECALRQDRYWDMHELLISNTRRLNNGIYTELANELNLDIGNFIACSEDPAVLDSVNSDYQLGSSIGVNGTPRFFIGRLEGGALHDAIEVAGARSLDYFDRQIQKVVQGG